MVKVISRLKICVDISYKMIFNNNIFLLNKKNQNIYLFYLSKNNLLILTNIIKMN